MIKDRNLSSNEESKVIFENILKDNQNYNFFTFILDKRFQAKGIKFLDLGARFPTIFFTIYHKYGISKLYGVDINSEKECVKDYINWFNKNFRPTKNPINANKYATWFDIYRAKYFREDRCITNRDQFDDLIKNHFQFGKDVENYLRELGTSKKFHIINAQNLLHFVSEKKQRFVVGKISNLIENNGLVNIRVQNREDYDKDLFYELIETNFDRGFLYEVSDGEDSWSSLYYQSFDARI